MIIDIDNSPNIAFVVHDAQGRILRCGKCPPGSVDIQASGPGETALQADWFDGAYVVDGALVPRPASPVALIDMTLTGVPVPAVVRINAAQYEADESTVELDITYPGKYRIVVEAWPYLDAEFEVTI